MALHFLIRSKILNYEEDVNSICGDERVFFCLNTDQCNCAKEEIIKSNIKFSKNIDLKITEQEKTVPIKYWLQKMHKPPVNLLVTPKDSSCFKNCSTKTLLVVSKVFTMIF